MKHQDQIRDFIDNTKSFVTTKNCSSFTDELWVNYLQNNAEHHPDFSLNFDYADFKMVCFDVYADIYEARQNTPAEILVFPTYGEGGKAFIEKPCNIICGASEKWIIMDKSDIQLFTPQQQEMIKSEGLHKVPYGIANEIRRRHNKADNV